MSIYEEALKRGIVGGVCAMIFSLIIFLFQFIFRKYLPDREDPKKGVPIYSGTMKEIREISRYLLSYPNCIGLIIGTIISGIIFSIFI